MNNLDILNDGIEIFDSEIDALKKVKCSLGENFVKIFNEVISTKGKVIVTGMGKPGHIATKVAATFSSLGIPSFFLHPAEAQHGDLGMVQKDDLVIAISYSGESTEVTRILKNIKIIGAKLIGITGNGLSTLAKNVDIVEVFPKFEEAGYLKLAPTSSTTVTLVYFDALAVAISKYKGFDKKGFGLFHPAGALGKKLLLKAKDIMYKGEENPIIGPDATLKECIAVMCKKPAGILNVVDNDHFLGIISDGDLRRAIYADKDINKTKIREIMIVNPTVIDDETLAVDALSLMADKKISVVPVMHGNKVVGSLQMTQILKEGISL